MKILFLFASLVVLSGCSSTNLANIIKAAAKDPAQVHFTAQGYGVLLIYDRNNPGAVTNAGTVTLTPTTTLKVSP